MLLAAKILLTIATLGYSAIPALVNSNSTHATNPSWDPHARFHVVWQVSSYVYVAVLALYLIWSAGTDTRPLWIAAALAAAAYGGFWSAVLGRPVYGGNLVSKVNSVPPVKWGNGIETDANITAFTVFVLLLVAGAVVLAAA